MRKIILFIFSIILFLGLSSLFSQSIHAAGQLCCPDRGYYNPDTDLCEWSVPTYGLQSAPTACLAGEVCVNYGALQKGVCSENSSDGNECCPGSTVFYDPTRNQCAEIISQNPYEVEFYDTTCGPDQWCDPDTDTCLSGTPIEPGSTETEPTTLLKPECCDIETRDILPAEVCEHLLSSKRGIQTALGCFPTQPQAIVQWVLKYAIMIAGGVGFLLMLYGSFQVMTSAGDPEKLKNGQQILTAAIIGILVTVFSLFLLRFIGWDILKIPGWN